MGFLDSNRVITQELQKTGTFNLDLASSSAQNSTDFNGIAYKTLKFTVSDIASDADVIIVVKAGTTTSYDAVTIYKSNGDVITEGITENGTYYADVSCIGGYCFQVTRRLESGTATVKWCLTQEPIPGKWINQTVKSIIPYVIEQEYTSNETLDLSTVKDLKTVATKDNFKCIVIHVGSISDGAKLSVRTAFDDFVFYRSSGELTTVIDSKGVYYIPVSNIFLNVFIRNTVAVTEGSASVRIGYLSEVPQDVVNMKPIQEIAGAKVDASNSLFTVIAPDAVTNILKYFKYYFVSFVITNGSSPAERTVTLSAQPYFVRTNGSTVGGKLEELSVSDTYTNTTTWQEIKSNYGVRLYMKFESYTDGDTVECHVFGVR